MGKLKRTPAERVAVARRLIDVDRAVAVVHRPCRPMRASTVGSCCSAGRYSFWMIEGGTFQVGLTVMYFISARQERRLQRSACRSRSGCSRPCAPFLNTRSWNSGMLTMHVGVAEVARHASASAPCWRGSMSIWRSRGGPLSSLTVRASSTPVTAESLALLELLHRVGELGVVAQVGLDRRRRRAARAVAARADPPSGPW